MHTHILNIPSDAALGGYCMRISRNKEKEEWCDGIPEDMPGTGHRLMGSSCTVALPLALGTAVHSVPVWEAL